MSFGDLANSNCRSLGTSWFCHGHSCCRQGSPRRCNDCPAAPSMCSCWSIIFWLLLRDLIFSEVPIHNDCAERANEFFNFPDSQEGNGKSNLQNNSFTDCSALRTTTVKCMESLCASQEVKTTCDSCPFAHSAVERVWQGRRLCCQKTLQGPLSRASQIGRLRCHQKGWGLPEWRQLQLLGTGHSVQGWWGL
jgi:hypothetical protein